MRSLPRLVLLVAAVLAVAGARPYAGGWNDGSRLATAESLVDRGTLAIDDSIFVRVPPERPPYPANEPLLLARGTLDKLLVDGRFYSDKPPLPSVAMAGLYALLKGAFGLEAARQPALFCLAMTIVFASLPYLIACHAVRRLAELLLGGGREALVVVTSFALATVAPVYARHVNGHILLLGLLAPLTLGLVRLALAPRGTLVLLGLGLLVGFGYAVEPGLGPFLLVLTTPLVLYRARWRGAALFAAGVLPPVLLHHILNYSVGGTLLPANTVAAYLSWPGSPFDASNMTGPLGRRGLLRTAGYAAELLAGKRGFLLHDPALLLPVAFLPTLWAVRRRELWAEGVWAAALGTLTWLLYALTSTNASGECLSIRWFVPLLAPGFLLVTLVLRERPSLMADLLLLSAWGFLLALLAWPGGPWRRHLVPLYWPVVAVSLLAWGLLSVLRARRAGGPGHR